MNEIAVPYEAPVFAMERLRIATDGPGITTLVCFMGCPLHCAYCLNEHCHDTWFRSDGRIIRNGIRMLSPQQLYEQVKIDNLYFQTTGGGICFGGGEPTQYSNFIKEFRKYCGNRWKITIETALRCTDQVIQDLADVVDYWIVDVKDMHDSTYKAYTGKNSRIKHALLVLKQTVQTENIVVKVPLIPDYNQEQQVNESVEELKQMGFSKVKTIRYIKRLSNV